MAPHHLFGYNDARTVIEMQKVSLPFLKRVYWRWLTVGCRGAGLVLEWLREPSLR